MAYVIYCITLVVAKCVLYSANSVIEHIYPTTLAKEWQDAFSRVQDL